LYLIRWIAYSFLFLTAHRLAKRKKNIKKISIILILSSFAVSALGLIQYLYIKDFRFLRYFGWDDHYYRLIGPFIDPTYTGIIICLGLLLAIVKLKKNLAYYLIILTNILAIFLTYSRSTYLALFSGLLLIGIDKKIIKKIIPIVIVILIIIKLLPSEFGESTKLTRISTIFYRIDNYQSAIEIIKDNPIFGVGFNNIHLVKEKEGYFLNDKYLTNSRSGFDNSILSTWIMSGIIGVISLLAFGLKLAKKNFLAIFLIPILIHSLFSNTIFYPWVMIWFWVLLGIFKDDR
jgi:O-antigen ligase